MKHAPRSYWAAVILMIGAAMSAAIAQSAKAPRLTQAPVPPGTAPVASKDQPYVYRKVNDNLYIIAEIHQPFPKNEVTNPPHTQQMGLVIGSKKAALIDTGLGLADLRKFVSQFTSLPIIVLNTHGHVDHVGANQLFDLSYITREDEPAMLKANRAERLKGYMQFMEGNAEMIAFAEKSMISDKPFKYDFLKDGDRVDLGGVELEVVAFPGHSPGSVAFIDRRDNVAFCGDSILFRVLLGDREKLAQWLKSLDNFAEKTKGIDTIVNGHQWEPFHRSDIDEERALANAILNRKIKGTMMNILFADRMIYILGNKRIGLSNDN
jgi:hydroxyacylglutathione hydrolase